MNIVDATRAYESWAAKHLDLWRGDLSRKHDAMSKDVFSFFRATFYRWSQLFLKVCPEFQGAPKILAVGDLHVENFGTWRDAEGRLVWGVNDFDEASKMPYAIDLVRLAASALLAIEENSLKVGVEEALEALLIPYESAIKNSHGKPFVLEEDNPELRKMALSEARKPKKFWDKLEAGQLVEPPKSVEKILTKQMPEGTEFIRVRHRIAGLGSLGRPRYVMIGEWRSGLIAREAKAMLPPAYQWALGDKNAPNQYQKILDSAIRVPDPFVKIKKDYVLRRLSPHSSRIDLSKFPDERDDLVILKSMGKETANVHLGANGDVPQVAGDLELRPSGWLLDAAKRMVEATKDDWEYWRRHQPAEAEDAPAANAAPV